ncbi:MAG: aminotransferase class V-fold PLP-dependent enzyme [Bacillota bacterium]
MDVWGVREEFPALERCVYLNTGTVGPMPLTVLRRQQELYQSYHEEGPARPEPRQRLRDATTRAREALAGLLGAGPEAVALVESTTSGINVVALGLDWRSKDEVVLTELEHPAGRLPFAFAARRYGVRVRVAGSRHGTVTPETIAGLITERTRVVCVSHVLFTTGARLDLPAIAKHAREAGALLVVDGAQSAGALPLDMDALGADVYCLPGYKWCLGPEGSGAVFVSRRALEVLSPHRIGGLGLASFTPDGDYCFWDDARRFEVSTFSNITQIGLGLAVEFHHRLGQAAITGRIAALAARFRQGLRMVPKAGVVTPEGPDQQAGLVSFTFEGRDYPEVVSRLYHEHGIVIRSVSRPPALRASFHYFNLESEVDRLLEVLASF